jgi:hypothetical protein
MQISGISLALTWPRWLCLLWVLLGRTATVTSFPLSKHTGGGGVTPLSLAGVFIYSSCGKWHFSPLLWSFPPTTDFTSFPAPAFSGRLVLQFCEGLPLPPLWRSGRPALFATCLFYCCCLLFSLFFLFFPWVGVGLSRGLCWSGPGLSGEYLVSLSSPGVLLLPSRLGVGVWRCESPPGFSI